MLVLYWGKLIDIRNRMQTSRVIELDLDKKLLF